MSDAAAPLANAPSGPQGEGLSPVARPVATPDRTLYMIGNAHLDPGWLCPWQVGCAEARATFASALQRMEEYPWARGCGPCSSPSTRVRWPRPARSRATAAVPW